MKIIYIILLALVGANSAMADASNAPYQRLHDHFDETRKIMVSSGDVSPSIGDCKRHEQTNNPQCTVFWRTGTVTTMDKTDEAQLSMVVYFNSTDESSAALRRTEESLALQTNLFMSLRSSNEDLDRKLELIQNALGNLRLGSGRIADNQTFTGGDDMIEVINIAGGIVINVLAKY